MYFAMGNYEWDRKGRQKAIELLGGCCVICGVSNKLEFHHKIYSDGTDKWKLSKWTTAPTHRESLKHPERFQLLCRTCHKILHWYQKDPIRFEAVYQSILKINTTK